MDSIDLPINIETREFNGTRAAESYILDAKTKQRYVAGQTANASKLYLQNVEVLAHKLRELEITSRKEARQWLLDAAHEVS